jgi:hypothetical protein
MWSQNKQKRPTMQQAITDPKSSDPPSQSSKKSPADELRERVAQEYGFSLWRLYREREVAAFLDVDLSTLKRKRRKKQLEFVDKGHGSVGYLGIHIANFLILGSKALQCQNSENANIDVATGGSQSEPARLPTIGSGSSPAEARSNVYLWAQRTLKPRKNG